VTLTPEICGLRPVSVTASASQTGGPYSAQPARHKD